MDTNIIIYSFKPEHHGLRRLIKSQGDTMACSDIVRLETMGYHRLTGSQIGMFQSYFENLEVYQITPAIIDMAIRLRQQKAVSSPDAIVAATALAADAVLWTNNTEDFAWIPGLKWHNPMEKLSS